MATKRDFVRELKDYVKRSTIATGNETDDPMWVRFNAILLGTIKEILDEVHYETTLEELRRHVVVSLVAVIQATARRAIATIIDGKEEREEELPEPQEIKITLAMVRELKKREFSIGELVAHFSSVAGFEQISSTLQRVFGKNLDTILLSHFRDQPSERFKNPEEALASTRAQLVKLFYYRNIYCHEEGVGISVNDDEIVEFFTASLAVAFALRLLAKSN